jgi:hypothetical protein
MMLKSRRDAILVEKSKHHINTSPARDAILEEESKYHKTSRARDTILVEKSEHHKTQVPLGTQ